MTQYRASLIMLFMMLFAGSICAYGQRRVAAPPTAQPGVAQQAPETNAPRLAYQGPAPEQDQAWVDQEMYRIRRDLVRDAVNRMRYGTRDNRSPILDSFVRFLGPFLVFLVVTGFILWFIRTLLENRRWDKIARIQTEAHTKLLDKLGASQELLAYVESDAGKRFLEATPFKVEHEKRPAFALSRVLWSAQAGVVVTILGSGLLWLSSRFVEEDAKALLVFGTICMALGVGFLLSSAVSFALSRRFGLLNAEAGATTRQAQ